jgi:tetratricopeptide repeat protein
MSETAKEAGVRALQNKDARTAVDHLTQATQEDPQDAQAFGYLGLAYGQLDQTAKAVEYLKHATRLAPQSAPLRYNLGMALEKAGKKAEAVAAYRQALAVNAGYDKARQALIRLGETPPEPGASPGAPAAPEIKPPAPAAKPPAPSPAVPQAAAANPAPPVPSAYPPAPHPAAPPPAAATGLADFGLGAPGAAPPAPGAAPSPFQAPPPVPGAPGTPPGSTPTIQAHQWPGSPAAPGAEGLSAANPFAPPPPPGGPAGPPPPPGWAPAVPGAPVAGPPPPAYGPPAPGYGAPTGMQPLGDWNPPPPEETGGLANYQAAPSHHVAPPPSHHVSSAEPVVRTVEAPEMEMSPSEQRAKCYLAGMGMGVWWGLIGAFFVFVMPLLEHTTTSYMRYLPMFVAFALMYVALGALLYGIVGLTGVGSGDAETTCGNMGAGIGMTEGLIWFFLVPSYYLGIIGILGCVWVSRQMGKSLGATINEWHSTLFVVSGHGGLAVTPLRGR